MAILSVLDSSLVFFLPLAIDASLIGAVANHQALFWLLPIVASLGSVAGASFTYWAGARLGEEGLSRVTSEDRLNALKEKISHKGAIALALPALIPPPFPFTPWILACGALGLNRTSFLITLFIARLSRFGGEAVLARLFGERILNWIESDVARSLVIGLAVIAIAGSLISGYRLWKSTRTRNRSSK